MELHMLKKFDTKTARVKGLSFHPHRPWILVSLHNGVIQLYDYRMEILLDTFEEHDGPVRGIDFHRTQPLFVSGGDDYKVKVWNYQLKRCLYTLMGHLDYVRTVQFHPNDYPWILSASDDQTVRIWNWQSRSCLLVLTGHNHYVMCAQWHPSEDLILSASLDQTIRIWDIGGLRKRQTSIVEDNRTSSDVFGNVDAVVKFVLEGHSRGVNWASFHPTLNLVVSGADDREVKIWRMSGSRAWETTTYRGHLNNVSCVLFHPKENVIISNSEDKSLRVWDISRNHSPLSFRRENDRYWILASHPRLNLLAAGHDNGMIIFKLSRERPPYDIKGDCIYYYNEGYIRIYNVSKETDSNLMQTRMLNESSFGSTKRAKRPRKLLFNRYSSNKDYNILIFYDSVDRDDSEYELYIQDRKGNQDNRGQRSSSKAVSFVSKNRFASLETSGDILLKNMNNESKKKIKVPERNINYIFEGGPGRLLLRSSEWLTLFDVSSRKIIKEIQIQSRFPIKFVYWNYNSTKVALLSRFSVMICDNDLNDICTIYENAKVKSGTWDRQTGVFIYTTVTHMKYALPSGDHGIIKTLDEVLYISVVNNDKVYCLNRNSNVKALEINNTEYVFKKALTEKRYKDVKKLIEQGKLKGESIISYLQKKGFPEVALRFVEDNETRFELALECGNIDDAFDCATKINTPKCWNRFGTAALMQGNYRFVTEAYKQTLNFEKLMYLFVITGNFPMLNKLSEIAKSKNDKIMRFNISLLNGDIETRIQLLKDSNQFGLAYLTAKSHNLNEEAEKIKNEHLQDKNIVLPDNYEKDTLYNLKNKISLPKPVFGPFTDHEKYDWPRKEVVEKIIDTESDNEYETKTNKNNINRLSNNIDDMDSDINVSSDNSGNNIDDFGWDEENKTKKTTTKDKDNITTSDNWDVDDDLVVSEDENEDKTNLDDNNFDFLDDSNNNNKKFFSMPKQGKDILQQWYERNQCPSDMIACGKFDLAQEALHRQFGIINFKPLKEHFLYIYSSCRPVLRMLPNSNDIFVPLKRKNIMNNSIDSILPSISYNINTCHDIIKNPKYGAYCLVTKAQFEEAILLFRKVLYIVPLIIINNNDELKDARQLIKVCKEYIVALNVKLLANKEEDKLTKFELNCHFTHFELEDAHVFSGLYGAIKIGYTIGNYITTGILCRRLLELAVSGKVKSQNTKKHLIQVQKVSKKCESKIKDDKNNSSLTYKPHDYQGICNASYKTLNRNDKIVKCPYCQSIYLQSKYNGKLCNVCNLVRIGSNAQGVKQINN